MQQFLKSPPGTAGAGVVAAELLDELLAPSHDPPAALHARLGRETLSAFTRDLESTRLRGSRSCVAWDTSGGSPEIGGAHGSWTKRGLQIRDRSQALAASLNDSELWRCDWD